MNENTYTCRICGKEFTSKYPRGFKTHIEKDHSLVWEDYLREYHPELGGYCLECGKETSYVNFTIGFKKFCSNSCGAFHEHRNRTTEEKNNITNKYKNTSLLRYGVENPSQSEKVKEKSKQTNLERYGVEHVQQAKTIKEKSKTTNLVKYGNVCVLGIREFQDKIKQTNLERYGVEYPLASKIVQEKSKETNLIKYGVECIGNSKIIRNRSLKRRRINHYNFFKTQLLENKHIEILDTKEEYSNSDTHRYFCKEHGEFESAGVSLQHVFCPCCYKEQKSKAEKSVKEFLDRYVSCETSNRTILSGKELDILIPEKNLAIEFDGLYWHSNLYKEKNYHLDKTKECITQGIQLIHIFENEWLNKRHIVESILLAKLGIFQKRLFARKCSVKIVPQETYREFTELNHLQGYVPAKLVLGLFHEDELVEVCSFGKSRFKSGEMELLRHCSLLNTQIIGGFSKLIKAWKKLNPNEDLYTYCDRRYSTGKSYEASGWTKVSESAPNYFYISKTGLESRIKYQKHKLDKILNNYDESLTEQENMSVNGFTWIYDCGNLKYKILKG